MLITLGILLLSGFANAIQETIISVGVTCSSPETNCDLVSDKLDGDCRFVEFGTAKGKVVLQACDKGDKIEVDPESFEIVKV